MKWDADTWIMESIMAELGICIGNANGEPVTTLDTRSNNQFGNTNEQQT